MNCLPFTEALLASRSPISLNCLTSVPFSALAGSGLPRLGGLARQCKPLRYGHRLAGQQHLGFNF